MPHGGGRDRTEGRQPPLPQQAEELLEAACAVAQPGVGSRSTLQVKPPPEAVLSLARVLLRLVKGYPAISTRVGQAITAVYLALTLTGRPAGDVDAFLAEEGVVREDFNVLLRPPSVAVVPSIDDSSHSDDWHQLCRLECPPGSTVTNLVARCLWQDQGWGNKKGRVRVLLLRGGEPLLEEDAFGLCGEPERSSNLMLVSRPFGPQSPVVTQARPGDVFQFEYLVGGGGGHQLKIRNFVAELSSVGPAPAGSRAAAQVEPPPPWLAPLLGHRAVCSITEVEYLDNDGDRISFKLEDGQLIKYVNGHRHVGRQDPTGVVQRLRLSPVGQAGPWAARVEDQHGWGGSIPMQPLLQLQDLAVRAGVPIEDRLGVAEVLQESYMGSGSDDDGSSGANLESDEDSDID